MTHSDCSSGIGLYVLWLSIVDCWTECEELRALSLKAGWACVDWIENLGVWEFGSWLGYIYV